MSKVTTIENKNNNWEWEIQAVGNAFCVVRYDRNTSEAYQEEVYETLAQAKKHRNEKQNRYKRSNV